MLGSHVGAVLIKLGGHGRTQAAIAAYESGLVRRGSGYVTGTTVITPRPRRAHSGLTMELMTFGRHKVAAYITICHTCDMAKAISVRLDDETERALQTLESSGLTRSEAIRSSLLSSAARLRRGPDLAAEAAALEADETDREEMLAVAALMESLRAPR